MQAMILAAGLGTRLRPHTYILPKPLIPLANVPLLKYHLQWLKRQGVDAAAVNLHYLPHRITAAIGHGDEASPAVKYSWEPVILGTGGGIRQMAGVLSPKDTFIVINSDMLTNVDLAGALEQHRRNGALATMLLTRAASVDRFGGVGVDAEGRVRRIANHIPNAPDGVAQGVFAGIHLVEPEILRYIPEGEVCINAQVYPELIRQGYPVYGYFIPDSFFWRHLGSQGEYLGVHEELLSRKLPLPIGRWCQELTPDTTLPEADSSLWIENPALIEPGAEIIPPVVIGRYCHIRARAKVGPYVSLDRGCVIPSGCRIEHCIIWDGIELEPDSNLSHTVISSRGGWGPLPPSGNTGEENRACLSGHPQST